MKVAVPREPAAKQSAIFVGVAQVGVWFVCIRVCVCVLNGYPQTNLLPKKYFFPSKFTLCRAEGAGGASLCLSPPNKWRFRGLSMESKC